jgi:hypothetical protein
MGIATFPAAAGGLASVVKSVQRGTASGAGNITITAVNVDKTQVLSFSTGSAGTVAATGTVNAANGTASAHSTSGASGSSSITLRSSGNANTTTAPGSNFTPNPRYGAPMFAGNSVSASNNLNAMNVNAQNIGLNATNISGGSTSLTTAVYGVYLVNSTTLTATGPCRYEVVEYF